MASNDNAYLNTLESFARIAIELVEKGFSTEEELTPVYEYILGEVENLALKSAKREEDLILVKSTPGERVEV